MTNAVAIELVTGAWGYIGKAAGQLKDKTMPGVFFIGGEYQVWAPGLALPYLKPNAPSGAR